MSGTAEPWQTDALRGTAYLLLREISDSSLNTTACQLQ
jgi:hypothetical protein